MAITTSDLEAMLDEHMDEVETTEGTGDSANLRLVSPHHIRRIATLV
jgi:hypothetical protein